MFGEALGSISCVYDLWAQYEGRRWEASMHQEPLDVSMVGGPICVVMPPNTSKVKIIRNS